MSTRSKWLRVIALYSILSALFFLFSSCDGTKHLEPQQLLLRRNVVVSTAPDVRTSALQDYIRQNPNTAWPLGVYSMAGRDTTKAVNRILMRLGEPPVALDTLLTESSRIAIATAVQQRGYLNATAAADVDTTRRRATVTYTVNPGEPYRLTAINTDSTTLLPHEAVALLTRPMHIGSTFAPSDLAAARSNATAWMNNNGYYYFNKEAITAVCDTSQADHTVALALHVSPWRRGPHDPWQPHPRYTIRNITYQPFPGQKMKLRGHTLRENTVFATGAPYSAAEVQATYARFARLPAVQATNIHFSEVGDSLDATIQVARRRTHSIQLQPEGTNTAGDLGAALSVTYQNRNLFHGSEQLTVSARGAFEAIRDLDGYEGHSYKEFNIEARLTYPQLFLPYIHRAWRVRHNATSELAASYNWQNRPEFRRRVLNAAWRYRWTAVNSERLAYRFDALEFNYISMPQISEKFKHDYIDDTTNRNAILRYNYEDLFIMRTGFGFTFNTRRNIVRANVETAGNFLDALANICHFSQNELGQYRAARVAFAQYAKLDLDYTHLLTISTRSTLALHTRVGVAYAYGNSTILPFEKRYFSGGANSVRGWSVRTLGPGRYHRQARDIDFINQSGDAKLDLNAELRTQLFWKLQSAVFIDAGNIWTLRSYPEQPDGTLTLRNLWRGMAVGYGIGVRLNLDYFIVRLDLGMKAINPDTAADGGHYPIAHPRFSRDYALHFAVGMPF